MREPFAALKGWAARRDRLPEHRADLLAAAWWSGTRNVAELARTANITRDYRLRRPARPGYRAHRPCRGS
ncbi:hypothetical protein [Streptomyces sp. CB01249]|uniref:hypothetical protein n=1 Tax=Streptomyces sp. CB01249 TaxID=1703929 RepID=UPI001161166F|nr:hypothetical protein [Streptomyces sp. CB01249]